MLNANDQRDSKKPLIVDTRWHVERLQEQKHTLHGIEAIPKWQDIAIEFLLGQWLQQLVLFNLRESSNYTKPILIVYSEKKMLVSFKAVTIKQNVDCI